ncbi:hypothetical protein PCNPT3_12170 [Psychromonas sp. CNPT3]|uniref:GtrA family protein n=1 Tax=Psychromonas sp. CNPT3 TaxID=314282 RepID=UPI00006E5893|nr:GtrA family protein [Psychromonas sp. CNPT3]AGH82370.1 hypothetical protein PCNPT3_12170 [Psychromonas sp. CNPT3]
MFKKQTQLLSNLVTSDLQQKIRFATVGVINTVVAYLAFMIFYELSARYLISSIFSYFIGMIISYALNRTFVFRSKKEKGQFIPFCVVNFTSLAISTVTLFLLVHYAMLHVYLGQGLAVCVSMGINYLGYKIVFTEGVSMQKHFKDLYDKERNIKPFIMLQWGILIVFTGVTLFNLQLAMSANVAHDALPYMENYIGKFTTEGRWINFAFYYPLCALPAFIAASLANLFMFIFVYKVAMGIKKEYWLAIMVALLVINIPSFTMLLKWPMTIMPSCFMLAVLACNKDKLKMPLFLILAGILLFSTYPVFYFLMPLLYLSTLRHASYSDNFKFLCFWILGYVLGYVVANAFVYLYTFAFSDQASFIQFVSWRHETPSHSLSALLGNIQSSAGNFMRNFNYIGRLSLWLYIPIGVTALWALRTHFKYTVMLLLVVISLYVSVLPLGITVPLRSGVTFPIGMVMLLFIIPNKYWRLLTLLSLMIPFALQTYNYNSRYAYNREVLAQMLEKHDNQNALKNPQRFDKIVVRVDAKKMSHYMWEKTGSNSFKRVLNLRDHYIKPYLYQYDWKDAEIEFLNIVGAQIKGNVSFKIKDKILFVVME